MARCSSTRWFISLGVLTDLHFKPRLALFFGISLLNITLPSRISNPALCSCRLSTASDGKQLIVAGFGPCTSPGLVIGIWLLAVKFYHNVNLHWLGSKVDHSFIITPHNSYVVYSAVVLENHIHARLCPFERVLPNALNDAGFQSKSSCDLLSYRPMFR